jgi:hypothetical protein
MIKMKLVISKIFLLFLFLFYTYVIMFFTTTQTLRTVSIGNILEFDIVRTLIENNKSVESFLNFQISSSISLAEQKYSIFSNPIDLYDILVTFGDKKRLCKTSLKDSNNTDVREFIKKNCEE